MFPLLFHVRGIDTMWFMRISDSELEDLIRIYEADSGIRLSREAALDMATRLINLYLIIMKPIPRHGIKSPDSPED